MLAAKRTADSQSGSISPRDMVSEANSDSPYPRGITSSGLCDIHRHTAHGVAGDMGTLHFRNGTLGSLVHGLFYFSDPIGALQDFAWLGAVRGAHDTIAFH